MLDSANEAGGGVHVEGNGEVSLWKGARGPCSSEWGLNTSAITTIWERVTNADSSALCQTLEIRICILTRFTV